MKPIRRPELLRASKGRPCVRCNRQDGTTVRAHYTGIRQHAFGKGMGQKCHDHCSADLCVRCHNDMDSPVAKNDVERSEEWMFLILLTLARDIREEVL